MNYLIFVVFFTICCLLQSIVVFAKYKLKSIQLPKNMEDVEIFTDEKIAQYDGAKNKDKLVYMAIKGIVFDVTSGGGFYAPGASYNALTGKDSTRAVAKMSLEPADLNNDISDLGDEYLKALDEIVDGTYMPKYPIVGYMDYAVQERMQTVHDKQDL